MTLHAYLNLRWLRGCGCVSIRVHLATVSRGRKEDHSIRRTEKSMELILVENSVERGSNQTIFQIESNHVATHCFNQNCNSNFGLVELFTSGVLSEMLISVRLPNKWETVFGFNNNWFTSFQTNWAPYCSPCVIILQCIYAKRFEKRTMESSFSLPLTFPREPWNVEKWEFYASISSSRKFPILKTKFTA